jgi:ubiquinone/menaquinone biosynthesis C-methylase UbiE
VVSTKARPTSLPEPCDYRRWYETALGSQADADEKAVVFALADLKPGERVLDVGCGDGNYSGPAASATGGAVGVDLSIDMLRAAQGRHGGRRDLAWVQADGGALPFPDRRFDVVLAVTVLCFAADPRALAREMYRVLRPGGRIVLGELGRYSVWALARRVKGLFRETIYRHSRFFSPGELSELLREAGFRDLAGKGAVYYPPLNRSAILKLLHPMEAVGKRWAPWSGAFLAIRGVRDRDPRPRPEP